MLEAFYFSAVIASLIFYFVGIIMNLFIAVVIYRTWVKSHRISSSDKILFSLGITRFFMLALFLLSILYIISSNAERSVSYYTFFLLCWRFLDSISLWFVTLLNSLYCVKITNFQHSVFLLLKRNLSPKITRLMLACVLISAFTTLLYVVLRHMSRFPEFTTGRNGTLFDLNEGILSLVASLLLSSLLQFILNVTSASLLKHSLRRHIQKMKKNSTGFWNPQTEAHVRAMKLMIYFLILYIPYSVSTLLRYLPSYVRLGLGVKATCMIISALYPPGHSCLLILTHSKLKTKAKKILCFNK
ncbi:taste 2 receptor member 4 [Ictidomys tridecemlineatus]|uniref:taste receptor type 2 member 4 n=1 Tax=Ictidomys tridecemlineatus TaxID=43179 RepID=UPI00038BDA1D|nr:taste receptor type 2 member 4 [Ictidomys tridecemlineatus]KAG3277348.1 taste 2 receptor member 4 [Ictidomys tridecemlineatus]